MKMYSKYFKMHFKSSMQYRLSTFLLAISQAAITAGEVLAVWLLFKNFNTVGGWGFYESMLMFGIVTTVFSFNETFARGYDDFPNIIRNGELDRYLVRPVNIYFQIFTAKIEFVKFGRVVLGLILSVIAIIKLHIKWTILKVLVLLSTYLCGILVMLGILFIAAGISVFTVENLEFVNIITDGSKEFSHYPINIYKKWLRNIFTFIIPLACFNYLPMSYLLGTGSVPMWLCGVAPLFGMVFFIPCFLFFKFALTKYQGTGT